MRKIWRSAVAALGAACAMTVATTGVAAADNAVLSAGCSASGNVIFTVKASGGAIPAGSTWTLSASGRTSGTSLNVYSSPAVIARTGGTSLSVGLANPAAISSGTTVTLTPTNYVYPSIGYLRLTLQGYGGRAEFRIDSDGGGC